MKNPVVSKRGVDVDDDTDSDDELCQRRGNKSREGIEMGEM